ncbi:hypothetical protein [Streptomyces sp. NPDC050504]|uniref:hypothetical protein n=1 Tax=Streptomyces sp. NPDC050504 TaxID=3365618 RepID=UPI0037A904C9
MRGNKNRSTTRRTRTVLSAAVVVCAVTAVLPGSAAAESTGAAGTLGAGVERISVAPDGSQSNGDSAGASITPDGRHVVFTSTATNLVPGGTPGDNTPYVRDQRTGQNKRIGSYSPLAPPVITGDGQYVAYSIPWMRNIRVRQDQVQTGATGSFNCLAYTCDQPSLSAGLGEVAVVIRVSATQQRVEVGDWISGSRQTVATFNHTQSALPSISGDARRVAYQDGQTKDVFVWDRTSGTSTGPIEGPAKEATLVQLSDNGNKAVYLSGADTYVHDVSAGTAQLVPNVKGVAIDPTGRYLLYAPVGTTGPSLVLRDLQTGTDETVSDQPATAEVDAVSADGRDVVFRSAADDIVPGDTNGKPDLFIRRFY